MFYFKLVITDLFLDLKFERRMPLYKVDAMTVVTEVICAKLRHQRLEIPIDAIPYWRFTIVPIVNCNKIRHAVIAPSVLF